MNSKKYKNNVIINPPRITRNLNSAAEFGEKFADHEKYMGARLVQRNFVGQHAEYVTFENLQLKSIALSDTRFLSPRIDDVRCEECDFANAEWERAVFHRTELLGCRMIGFKAPEAHFQDTLFRNCRGEFANFRFATFKAVCFQECNLHNVDFQGADLSGVLFVKCDLSQAEMSHAKLLHTDFRTSKVDGIKVGVAELSGAIVDHFQAAYLASLMGLVIKDTYDE